MSPAASVDPSYSQLALAALPPSVRRDYAGWGGLDAALDAWLVAGHAAWPQLHLAPELFIAFLAQRLPGFAPDQVVQTLRASDLYLACGCLGDNSAAIRAFQTDFLARLLGPLRRLDSTVGLAEEVRDRLAQQTLVGSPARPATLHSYRGHGDLWTWLRVSALRAALKLRRRQSAEQTMLDVLAGAEDDRAQEQTDPELRALKARFRGNFRAAFEGAFGALSVRERNVLAQHHLDGLSTEQLGSLYRVHRVTVSRWLSHARQTLLTRTRAALMSRLDLTPSECDSVIRIMQSQLDLTMSQLIAPTKTE